MSRRPGRKVLFERPYPEGAPKRYLSVPMAPELASQMMLPEALALLAFAQDYAEREAGQEVSLELLATVQHGDPLPIGFTLHFEVTPCAA